MDNDYSLALVGDVVTPAGRLPRGWVAVRDGVVAAIGEGEPPRAAAVHDCGAGLLLPGVIDGQTHAGSQLGFSGIEPTTRSAVAGGITTIVDMPYDEPDPVFSEDLLLAKAHAVAKHAYCDVALYATITNDSDLAEVPKLVAAGACAFKISSFENHPSRFPRIRNDRAFALLKLLAATDVPTGLHNEDQEMVRATIADFRARGATGIENHDASRPEAAELVATAGFLEMGRAAGAHVHIVHMTSPRGFELVRRYQADGARATGEMCVHYLHFDAAEDITRLGNLIKVNPPIRKNVREKLWAEVFGSGSEFVSSDHSAWKIERKGGTGFEAAAGIPGLETLLPAFYDGLVRRGHDAPALAARYLSERPAKFFGLWPRKGAIAVGADADFVILQPGPWRFSAAEAHDGLNWSPFDGDTFSARPVATFVRGEQVWDGEQIRGRAGHGRFVPRRAGSRRDS